MFLIEQYRYDVIIIFSNRVAVSYRHWLPCHSNALVHSENLARSRSRQLFQQSRLLLWSCDTVWIEINNFLHFFAYQQFKRYNCFWCPQCAMFWYQNTHCRVFWGFFFLYLWPDAEFPFLLPEVPGHAHVYREELDPLRIYDGDGTVPLQTVVLHCIQASLKHAYHVTRWKFRTSNFTRKR